MSAVKHNLSAQIISRGPNVWRVTCGRHAEWTGATYEQVEDEWRKHVHAELGVAPSPSGNKADRWQP